MKLRYLLLCAVMGFLTVSAETTLELIQQRAEAGDATAQTFLGMAYFYGYSVAPDSAKAKFWFGQAAEQGDKFAAKRCELWGQPIRTGIHLSTNRIAAVVQDDLATKVEQGANAPYAGKVSWDELVLHRNQYIGKVIELDFTIISAIGVSAPYIYVRDPRSVEGQSGSSDKLYLYGEAATQWRLDTGAKLLGTVSKVYALVEKDRLIGLGARQRKADDGYTYSW